MVEAGEQMSVELEVPTCNVADAAYGYTRWQINRFNTTIDTIMRDTI